MKPNLRLYVRSFQNVLFFNNPFIKMIVTFFKVLIDFFYFKSKSYNIRKNIYENTKKMEKTKKMLNTPYKNRSTINFLR